MPAACSANPGNSDSAAQGEVAKVSIAEGNEFALLQYLTAEEAALPL
jgi:hypothetical protein